MESEIKQLKTHAKEQGTKISQILRIVSPLRVKTERMEANILMEVMKHYLLFEIELI